MGQYAPDIYRMLNGVFCVYKPPYRSISQVIKVIKAKLTQDLNSMKCRPIRQRVVFNEEGGSSDNLPTVTTVPDLSDHPLVIGDRYQPEFFNVSPVSSLSRFASGVQVMTIGNAVGFGKIISRSNLLRVYHVKGELGRATQDFTSRSSLRERTTYNHVTHAKLDRVLTAFQAGHQKKAFFAMGIDMQSQEAFEVASRGLVRPIKSEAGTVFYGLKCIHFDSPHFTLEIHCTNESAEDLTAMIHEIGAELRSSAHCTQLRRIRYGDVLLPHALLQKHWTAQSVSENIIICRPLMNKIKSDYEKQIQKADPPELEKTASIQFVEDG